MLSHNRLSVQIHRKMIRRGYYKVERELPTIIMLMVSEASKLFDDNKLNKPEKLADLTMRLYDYCGWKKIKIEDDYVYNGDVDLPSIIDCLSNEVEAFRSNIETRHLYIKMAIGLCYKYAEDNGIDLQYEIIRKCRMLNKIKNKKKM